MFPLPSRWRRQPSLVVFTVENRLPTARSRCAPMMCEFTGQSRLGSQGRQVRRSVGLDHTPLGGNGADQPGRGDIEGGIAAA